MAVLYRHHTTVAQSSTSPRTTLLPTGTAEGDLLILYVAFQSTEAPDTVPSGFTLIPGAEITGTLSIRLYAKTATASEPADYSVTFSAGSCVISMTAYRSDAALALVVDDMQPQTNTTSTNRDWASATASVANTQLACYGSIGGSASTPDAAMTERYDSGSILRAYLMTQDIAASGATGTRTATGTAGSSKTISLLIAEVSAVDPPAAPSNLSATSITASRIDLTWQDNSSDETGFELERSTTGVGAWSLINSPAANVTTYSDTSLPPSTEIYYRIRAVNAGGNSAYSNIVEAIKLFVGRAPITPRLYLLQPEVVFAAQVNWPTAVYPIDLFDVDNVSVGTIAAAKAGLTILLGSAEGLDDYGRQRLRKDGGGFRLFVGRSSRGTGDGELTVVDNAYVTVLNDRRVWAKMPHIDVSGGIYKDSDLEVGTNTTTPPPVANTGPGQAGTIDSITGVITCSFNGQRSFAVADGATITGYLWDIADGTLVGPALLTTDTTVATFPPGFRYISLTVTDSNAKTHTAYAPVFARDPDNDESFDGFLVESERLTDAGKQVTIRILQDMPRATYPDGTLAMIWQEEPAGRPMLACGWLDTENATIGAGRYGLLRDTTLTILDVAGKLDTLPGLPQSIADDATRAIVLLPAITWNYMTTPNLDKYLHYLLYWHSTALEVADFVWSGTGSAYEFLLLSSDGDSLWNQVDRRARAFVPDRVLTHDLTLGIQVVPDPMLQNVADRTATVQRTILEVDWSDLRYTYQRAPRTHWLRASAILAGDTEPIGTVFSIAPGDTPGQGVGEIVQGEQLAISQAALNAATGHRYARANNRLGLLTLTVVQNDSGGDLAVPWSEIRPALKEWVVFNVSAETAAQRGLTFTSARCLPKEVTVRRDHRKTGTLRTVTLTLEVETVGETGKTITKPTVPGVGDTPPWIPPQIPPPDFGLITGQQLVAGIGLTQLYRTANFQTLSGVGGPTWTAHTITTEDVISWVVDPFSPGYLTGVGAINGWVVTATNIYRVTDIFGSIASTSIHTFAVPLGGSSVPAQEWRTIQASFGTYFAEGTNPWLMVVSHYRNTTGHVGTWALRSVDGGVTWAAEVQISAFYDSSVLTDTRPIALYLSPKTPGYALTVAYTATADPAPASGYESTDWGATWAQKTLVDTGVRLGGDIHVPWLAGGDNTIYHGRMAGGTASSAGLIPSWGLFDDNTLVYTPLADGASSTADVFARDETAGAPSPNVEDETYLCIAPPATTARLNYSVQWVASRDKTGASSSVAMAMNVQKHASMSQTGTDNFVVPAYGGETSGTFAIELTWGGADWPANRDSVVSDPPNALSELGARIRLDVIASCSGAGNFAEGAIDITVTVTEIELDDGTIYTPVVNATRAFTLRRVNASSSIDDLSPVSTAVNFGPSANGFRIRAHDSNANYLVASLTGNDATDAAANDTQAVFVSIDAGATWDEIVAPVTSTSAFAAAWSGDLDGTIYIWGPSGYMAYSIDSGVTLDDRSGNLSALSATVLRGIAGGPS